MKQRIANEINNETRLEWRGRHKGVGWVISVFNIKEQGQCGPFDFKASWASYICITEDLHEKIKNKINSAPWNGGQTYYRKITEIHVDTPKETADRFGWNKSYYKIGDDYSHLWDSETHRGALSVEYIKANICAVIDYLLEPSDKECE